MQDVSRRALVRDMATAVAGVGLVGAATIGGDAEAKAPEGPAWVAEIEAQLATLSVRTPDGPVASFLTSRGHRDDILPRMARGMAFATAFRDLPHRVQKEAIVQDLLWREAPEMVSSMFELSDVLSGLSPEEREWIGAALAEDPSLLEETDLQIEVVAKRRGLSIGRRKQLRSWTGGLGWQLRKRKASRVVDDTLRKMDKLCGQFGFAREEWRAASTSGLGGGSGDAGGGRMDPVLRAGIIMMGVGGGAMLLGLSVLLGAVVADNAGLTAVGLILGFLGFVVLVVGGILLVVGLIRRKHHRESSGSGPEPMPAPEPIPAMPAPAPDPAPEPAPEPVPEPVLEPMPG